MNNKLVSVIIPTYSRPTNLLRAIKSVLAQTYKNIEIIVVDDNGIDSPYQKETEKILEQYIKNNTITYIKHKNNINGSAARNTGFKSSKGDYINFLDDDDEFLPEKIQLQVERLDCSDSLIGACYCNSKVQFNNHSYVNISKKEGNLIKELFLMQVSYNTSTLLLKREALEFLNGFDESYIRHQDYEFLARFYGKYEITHVRCEKYLLIKYQEANNISKHPENLIRYREYYLSNFEKEIQETGLSEDIYHIHYKKLGELLIFYNRYKLGIKCLIKANIFKLLSIKDCLNIVIVLLKSLVLGIVRDK